MFTRHSELERRAGFVAAFCAAPLLLLAPLQGCGSHAAPQVGAITVTDSKGVAQTGVTGIAHGTALFLDVTILEDAEGLGADWTVTCSSALAPGSLPAGMIDTSCGTFVPYHTLSGPIPAYPAVGILTQFTAPGSIPSGGTVTLIVHASSQPSRTASLTLKVT